MSSPNEPGYPRGGDGGGNGAVPGPAHGAERNAEPADVPPWQRGQAARGAKPPPRAQEAPARHEPARGTGNAPGHGQPADARLNRFLSGGAPSPEKDAPPRGERTETVRTTEGGRPDGVRPEQYASEIPDLSGPMPRPPQRKPPQDQQRGATEPVNRPAPGGRLQVGARQRGPVRATMQIRHVDPWSTLKVSLVLSVALFFVWMIAVALLYLVLGGMGVWSKLNSNVGDLLTSASGSAGGELVSSGTIFGGAVLIGLVNIVLLTAMATLGAFIYNLTTDIVGGVEVTLADRD
ncbi:DUF3566 domain-containing protein [Mycolicibacterium sp. XJ1819]